MIALDLFRRRDGAWRVDPATLYPPFLARLIAALTACHDRGHDYYATSGLRSFDSQAILFRAHLAGGPRAAPAGLSAHNYGLAVDLGPDADEDTPGLQGPDYRVIAFAVLVEELARVDLASGIGFRDAPHVGWPGYVSARELAVLRDVWLAGAQWTTAVWRYLDGASP